MKTIYNKEKKLWEAQLTEEHIVKQIMEGLAWNRISCWRIVERIPWGKKKSTAGIPDIQGVVEVKINVIEKGIQFFPLPFFIEVKKPRGERKPWQVRFIEERLSEGCISTFAECWEDVIKAFADKGITIH